MKINWIKYVMILTAIPTIVFSQELSVSQRRYLKLDVLKVLNSYELSSQMSSDRQKREFLSLFENNQVEIYNDLLGISAARNLPVIDYANLLQKKIIPQSSVVYIKNVNYQEPEQAGDDWLIKITFDKEIEYSNSCGVLFSSSAYYGSDHKMEATIVWNSHTRDCKIRSLSGFMVSSAKPLPEDYIILTSNHPNDSLLHCNGEPITFNYVQQAFLDKSSVFSFPKDNDVVLKLKTESEECNMVSMSYSTKRWRLKPHVDFSLGDFYELETLNYGMDTKSSSYGFGVDIGYVFPSSKKLKWGLFSGIGFSKTELETAISDISYEKNVEGDADIDGDTYKRIYSMRDTKYKMSVTDLYVPLYLDVEYRFAKFFSMYVDLGIKGNINIVAPTTQFSTTYSVYGVYPQYNGLILDSHAGINGFVTNQELAVDDVNKGKFYDFVVDGFVGLGFRFCLYKGLFFDLGGYYQQGILNDYNCSGKVSLTAGDKSSAPMNYTTENGELVENVTGLYSSVNKKNFMLNLGLILKF